jgi:hypothetical protein
MRIQDKTHSPIELNSLDKPLIEHHPGYVTSVDVSLPQHLFLRLQKLAIPLVDTPASVIERLMDSYEENHPDLPERRPDAVGLILDPNRPDDLRHTRIREASFCEESARNWNELVQVAHRVAFRKTGSYDSLRRITIANIVNGPESDRGFVFLRDIGLSVQNVEANKAWRDALHLAKKLEGSIQVTFDWRDKEGAAHRGRSGLLRWPA